jgi:hypothetical protein
MSYWLYQVTTELREHFDADVTGIIVSFLSEEEDVYDDGFVEEYVYLPKSKWNKLYYSKYKSYLYNVKFYH